MLRRKITDDLLKWKNAPKKKCILLKGARQVGKTYIVDDFAKKNYGNYIYINFELYPEMKKIFDGNLDVDSIVRGLSTHFPKIKFKPGDLMIFLDEIQNCPNARVSLKSFSLDGRFDVIASGSLLGLNYKEVSSYPVGYETIMELRSLDFEEFLWAFGISDEIISYLSDSVKKKVPITNGILEKIDEYYRWYAITGGMPEAVNIFIETNSFGEVISVQKSIIAGYMNDISKYAPDEDKKKIWETFRSVPSQLSRENKKFRYSGVNGCGKGEGSEEYGSSLLWLYDAGIIKFCNNLQEPYAPLAMNMIPDKFKVYLHDTGLLVSMMDPGVPIALLGGDMKINKGAIAENMTAEALSKKDIPLLYFAKNKLEVEFFINVDGIVTALEVRSGNNKRSKSLDVVMSSKYEVERGIKLEKTNIHTDEKGVEHYPLFASSFLFELPDLRIIRPNQS
ncbi:MAG: AAA family ATPase [Methanomassiliicoccaceae archaeon]|nr:AAA family ATPase [Methanomassiliicoccaceae archaeon]